MSLDAFRWVCQQTAPSTGAFAVLCALANFTGAGKDICWPSQQTLADITRLSRRRVIVHINALCEEGLVERVTQRRRLCYRLRMENSLQTSLKSGPIDNVEIDDEIAHACAVSAHGYDKMAQRCDKTAYPSEPVKEAVNVTKKGTDISSRSDPARFEEFWELYPRQRRGNRGKALAAYKRVLADGRATEDDVCKGLRTYTTSRDVRGGYARNPVAWLDDDGWANEYTAGSCSQPSKHDRARAVLLGPDNSDFIDAEIVINQ